MLRRIFYVSDIVEPLSDTEVQVLLGQAQIRNRRLDVTGVLVRADGHFAQVLEGRSEAIDQVMAKISASAFHRDLRVLSDESAVHRQFGTWAMGLVSRSDMTEELRMLHVFGILPRQTPSEVMQRITEGPHDS